MSNAISKSYDIFVMWFILTPNYKIDVKLSGDILILILFSYLKDFEDYEN